VKWANTRIALSVLLGVIAFRSPIVRAFQGMAAPERAPRAVERTGTNLAPIGVDFKDIAAEAGLTAPTVSGGEATKKYLIESTGVDRGRRLEGFFRVGGPCETAHACGPENSRRPGAAS
jgi:hypothetical protein